MITKAKVIDNKSPAKVTSTVVFLVLWEDRYLIAKSLMNPLVNRKTGVVVQGATSVSIKPCPYGKAAMITAYYNEGANDG